CPKVAYIESDVGQSKFIPSGPVSLNILNSPIFDLITLVAIRSRLLFVIVYRRDIACGPDLGIHVDEEVNTFITILFINSFVSKSPTFPTSVISPPNEDPPKIALYSRVDESFEIGDESEAS
ncbi:2047_t:CDS:2, partial [Cetraspora pellucida]